MKGFLAAVLFLGLSLAQTVTKARCETHSGVKYCLAGINQTVEYQTRVEEGFAAVLFAQEAMVEGKKQTDFAGLLIDGQKVQFRNGIVVHIPENLVGVLAHIGNYLKMTQPRESSQPMVVCPRMELGDKCATNDLQFRTWSVSLWINKFPVEGSEGYSVIFFTRDTAVDPTSYTLPKEAFVGECGCEKHEYPGIFILLKQQSLAKFHQPQPLLMGDRRI